MNMGEKTNNTKTRLSVIFSFLAVVLVALIGYCDKVEREKLWVAVEDRRVDIERARFDADQHAQVESVLAASVPHILHIDPEKHYPAIATLFALYPNDAKDILSRIAQSVGDIRYYPWLIPAIQRAESLNIKTGSWIIVIRSDPTLEDALLEAKRTKERGYTPVVIYKQGEWFVTTVGDFHTERHAERATIPIRGKLRGGAFVVNLHRWCPEPVDRNGYYHCQGQ
jgi:hypothetical protein